MADYLFTFSGPETATGLITTGARTNFSPAGQTAEQELAAVDAALGTVLATMRGVRILDAADNSDLGTFGELVILQDNTTTPPTISIQAIHPTEDNYAV